MLYFCQLVAGNLECCNVYLCQLVLVMLYLCRLVASSLHQCQLVSGNVVMNRTLEVWKFSA